MTRIVKILDNFLIKVSEPKWEKLATLTVISLTLVQVLTPIFVKENQNPTIFEFLLITLPTIIAVLLLIILFVVLFFYSGGKYDFRKINVVITFFKDNNPRLNEIIQSFFNGSMDNPLGINWKKDKISLSLKTDLSERYLSHEREFNNLMYQILIMLCDYNARMTTTITFNRSFSISGDSNGYFNSWGSWSVTTLGELKLNFNENREFDNHPYTIAFNGMKDKMKEYQNKLT